MLSNTRLRSSPLDRSGWGQGNIVQKRASFAPFRGGSLVEIRGISAARWIMMVTEDNGAAVEVRV